MLSTLMSVSTWDDLTFTCGWSTEQYLDWMRLVVKRTFVRQP